MEVAEYVSPVERALAGWLLERPVRLQRLPVALLSREQRPPSCSGSRR